MEGIGRCSFDGVTHTVTTATRFGLQLCHRSAVAKHVTRIVLEKQLEERKHSTEPGQREELSRPTNTFVFARDGSTHCEYVLQATSSHGPRKHDPVYACVRAQWSTHFSRERFRDGFRQSVLNQENVKLTWDKPEVWEPQMW